MPLYIKVSHPQSLSHTKILDALTHGLRDAAEHIDPYDPDYNLYYKVEITKIKITETETTKPNSYYLGKVIVQPCPQPNLFCKE